MKELYLTFLAVVYVFTFAAVVIYLIRKKK